MMISEAQFVWLETVLEQAAASGKPAFVFSHYPADDVIDEDGNPTRRLTELLASYNRSHDIFCFVGHTHMPLFLFWSFHDDEGFPEIYLPRLTDLGGENDRDLLPRTGDGLEIEVYANEVLVRGRDFYRGEWKYDAIDETMCEVIYPLKHPVTAR